MGAVLERGRRQRRRQIAGVLSLVLIAGVGAAFVFRPDENRTLKITQSTTESPAPDPAPIGLGWLPGGFGAKRVLYLGPQAWSIDASRTDPFAMVSVQVMSREPKIRQGTGELRDVEVDGTDAKLYWVPAHEAGDPKWGNKPPEAEGPFAELTYQRKPGQWAKVVAQNSAGRTMGLTEQDIIKIAENITDERNPVADVVRLTLPAGTAWGRVIVDERSSRVALIDPGTRPAAVSLNDEPNGHGGDVRARISIQVVARDSTDVKLLPLESDHRRGEKTEPLDPSTIRPDGLLFRGGDQLRFVHPVTGHDDALSIISIAAADELADAGSLRKLAESIRLGPDAVF